MVRVAAGVATSSQAQVKSLDWLPSMLACCPCATCEKSRGARFIIAESEDGSSTTARNCALRGRRDNKDTEQKKCPPTDDGHNPRSGQETQNLVRCAASSTPSAITHIGCVYADEPSIGRECDLTMTLIKGARVWSGTFTDGIGPHDSDKKKARWLSGLQTIFLEENSGDRCIMLRCDICVQ
jgi:hypothetical protein